jgi:hypothetical protein
VGGGELQESPRHRHECPASVLELLFSQRQVGSLSWLGRYEGVAWSLKFVPDALKEIAGIPSGLMKKRREAL